MVPAAKVAVAIADFVAIAAIAAAAVAAVVAGNLYYHACHCRSDLLRHLDLFVVRPALPEQRLWV